MGDSYHISNTQAGAIGKQASAVNTTFNNRRPKETQAQDPAGQPAKKARPLMQRIGEWLGKAAGVLGLQALKKLIFKE